MNTQLKLNYQIVGNEVLLSWNNITGINSYYIYRRTDMPVNEMNAIGNPYRTVRSNRTKDSIPNCSAYTYMVSTPDQVTTSNSVTIANVDCNNVLPISLAGDFSHGQINLNWNQIKDATSYFILQVTSPQDTVGILDYANQNNTSYSFPSRTNGQNIFRVVAYDNNGILGLSNPVTVTTNTITNFQILNVNASRNQVVLNWTPIANASYTISRNGQNIGNSNIPSFTDNNVEIGQTYTYVIGANNQYTNPVSVVVPNTSGNNNIPITPVLPKSNNSIADRIEESSFMGYGVIVVLILIFIILVVILFANNKRR